MLRCPTRKVYHNSLSRQRRTAEEDFAVYNYHSALRNRTQRSTTAKPSASCARCDAAFSSKASDAISTHPCLRAQSSAASTSFRPIPRFRWLSATYQPSMYPTACDTSHPSACERNPTSRKPTSVPPASVATSSMSGIVPKPLPERISSSSLLCSTAEDSGHSASRNRASCSRSSPRAALIPISTEHVLTMDRRQDTICPKLISLHGGL